jgi:hypothetical protein
MFNDRDLVILGGGALLAVLCLFLPFLFAGRIVAGFLVLSGFMLLALMRLGPDRVPPEVWLMRRVRYHLQARKYVNQRQPTRFVVQAGETPAQPVAAGFQPLELAWGEVGVYPLLSLFLAVVAVYFAVWLARGGAAQLARWFG